MKFLRTLRSKSKGKNELHPDTYQAPYSPPYSTPPRRDKTAQLPPQLLEKIFSFVCPHTRDESYESCEDSAVEDACMLCDLRDLAHCARVSWRWRMLASNVLYHSIRIDTVHYCDREITLAEKRKQRSFFDRNADPHDPTKARLTLLCRTLRDSTSNPPLGELVIYLKTPYMTRESCKADLARTVAVLPNLKYVDLPDGFYADDASCLTLKLEVQNRCRDIRKMTYMAGGERSLEGLGQGNAWQRLEVLELIGLNADPTMLRRAMGALPNLRVMKISEMESFDDTMFEDNQLLPPFPALSTLHLEEVPNVTAAGLVTYLSHPFNSNSLVSLSLKSTGVLPYQFHSVLSAAPRLTDVSIIESVAHGLPADPNIKFLTSPSVVTMHYEITGTGAGHNGVNSASASYYAYLTSSLLSSGLPELRYLYVRDPDFPESLLALAPPVPVFAADDPPPNPFSRSVPANKRFSSNNPFAAASAPTSPNPRHGLGLTQELEVYSKGLDEMEWNFATVKPPERPGRRGSATAPRPISTYGISGDNNKPWNRGDARRSVIVGNGFGGFLAVPPEESGRPSSSAGEKGKRGSSYDMWR